MKNLLVSLGLLLLFSNLRAEINIQVIYPRPNQQIVLVDSTFIFGNVPPESKLFVNGRQVDVYKDGGWLAFIEVAPGKFNFHVLAVKGNDSASLDVPVVIGAPEAVSLRDKYAPNAVSPNSKAIYKAGGMIEFSFEAPKGGTAQFWLDKRKPIKMYESYPAWRPTGMFEADERIPAKERPSTNSLYTGYYRFTWADTGLHSICYQYSVKGTSEAETPYTYKFCMDTVLTVLPEYPPLVGLFTGQSQIVRTAPGQGYKLLYQPAGIPVEITGMRDNFYEIALSSGITGFVNVDSVTILPSGAVVPRGRISIISVDSTITGAKVSADFGAKLPYEVNESWGGRQIDIDIYGLTSSIDWIRYNSGSSFVKLVRWSQPQDGIFRMTIETDGIWGYKVSYDDTKFVIELNKGPAKGGMFARALKGKKIVIDPGHSHDSGAIGPTGLQEQDANLWIAHELRKMLEKEGATVLMTRYGHEHVPLYNRPQMAENWGAYMLISVHNNALNDGVNPFYNNGTSAYYYYPHSKPLAEAIHRRMLKATGLPDHGLYYGNLVITRYSSVPSVLIECAFMMIPEQEAMLKTNDFQRKCAGAIKDGIEDFFKQRAK